MRVLPQEKGSRRRSGNDPAAGELGGVDRGKPDGAPLHSGCLFGRYSVVGATRIGLSYSWLFCPAERMGQSCVGSAAQVVRKLTRGCGGGWRWRWWGHVGVALWRTRRLAGCDGRAPGEVVWWRWLWRWLVSKDLAPGARLDHLYLVGVVTILSGSSYGISDRGRRAYRSRSAGRASSLPFTRHTLGV